MPSNAHVVIIVQNLPVPLDRRVWLEAQALVSRGYRVSVICPKGPGDPKVELLDGVWLYKYRPAPDANGLASFIYEFGYSWLRTAILSLQIWRRDRFDIIQACNPPDTYWLLARLWRRRGVKFVFDQHDLNPELFLSRFGEPKSRGRKLQLGVLRWLEKMTYKSADRVISTNESYKNIAVTRGRRNPADVTVVRSGPDTRAMRPIYPNPAIRGDGTHVLAYLGVMGPQDGVETVLDVMHELVHRRGRTGLRAVLLGFGDTFEDLKRRSTELGLDDVVTFTGRADRNMVADYLSAADIGLCPDPKTPLNDLSTMNKTMEYMAYALPSVAFDLKETRVSGGDAVLYVESGDLAAFADAVESLLDDATLRAQMGLSARERVSRELDWAPQSSNYLSVFDSMTGRPVVADEREVDAKLDADVDALGRSYVDLLDSEEFERFVVNRTRPRPVALPVRQLSAPADRPRVGTSAP